MPIDGMSSCLQVLSLRSRNTSASAWTLSLGPSAIELITATGVVLNASHKRAANLSTSGSTGLHFQRPGSASITSPRLWRRGRSWETMVALARKSCVRACGLQACSGVSRKRITSLMAQTDPRIVRANSRTSSVITPRSYFPGRAPRRHMEARGRRDQLGKPLLGRLEARRRRSNVRRT